ncbi:putative E3 ubiquitin-protein ligase MARCHF10 [Ctenodactylus gundi]
MMNLSLLNTEPVVQQEGSLWTGVSKLKRPTRKRRNVISSSQLMSTAETLPARADEGDPKAYSFNEPQTVQRTKSPQELRVSVRPPLIHTTRGGPGRIPLGFQDEDFYSILPQNTEGENYDTEEEACAEEELPLLGVSSPHSPSSQKRSRFLKTTAIQAKDKNCEENAEHCRGNLSRIKPTRGSLRIRTAVKPVTEQSSAGERGFQDPGPPDEKSANENDSGDRENEKKTIFSQDSKSESRQDNDLSAENAPSGSVAMEDKPGGHGYEEDWQDNDSRNSVNCLLSDGPTALQSSVNSSYNSPGSSMHFALRENVPADLPMTPTLGHSLGSQRNSSFSVHRPLSPIRNRNPLANERHGYFPGNNAHEFSIRGTEAIALTSQPQGAPLHADVLLNSQSSSSLVDSSSSSPPRGNLQGHLQVPGFAQENVPFTFFTVSELPNQNENANSMVISSFTDENGATEVKAGSEKLKKLQESLLEEESEEEGDLCRICQIAGGSPANPLLEPCGCVGSLQFVHKECLKKWLKVKITSGADLSTVKTCEMCKQDLLVNLDDFNMTQFYQMHQQFRARNELMNSGFYLVLLLNLYEQRFAELMRLNYRRAIRERLSRNHLQGMLEENEIPGTTPGVPPRLLGPSDPPCPRAASGGTANGRCSPRPALLGGPPLAAGKGTVRSLKDLCVAAGTTSGLPSSLPQGPKRGLDKGVRSRDARRGARLPPPRRENGQGPRGAPSPAAPRRRPGRFPERERAARVRPGGFGWAGTPPSASCRPLGWMLSGHRLPSPQAPKTRLGAQGRRLPSVRDLHPWETMEGGTKSACSVGLLPGWWFRMVHPCGAAVPEFIPPRPAAPAAVWLQIAKVLPKRSGCGRGDVLTERLPQWGCLELSRTAGFCSPGCSRHGSQSCGQPPGPGWEKEEQLCHALWGGSQTPEALKSERASCFLGSELEDGSESSVYPSQVI